MISLPRNIKLDSSSNLLTSPVHMWAHDSAPRTTLADSHQQVNTGSSSHPLVRTLLRFSAFIKLNFSPLTESNPDASFLRLGKHQQVPGPRDSQPSSALSGEVHLQHLVRPLQSSENASALFLCLDQVVAFPYKHL
jgi:hypothetical protein